jgi:hypothetical protein
LLVWAWWYVPGLEVFPSETSPFGWIGAYRTDLSENGIQDGRRETAEYVKKVVLHVLSIQPTMQSIAFPLQRPFLEVTYRLMQETYVPEHE